ncbi:Chaperone protein DnaJ [Fasciola gigantica]|uniref:DnaJ homolog subfamily C member 16 n=1 Tax=Fasciola gigantica TaxID=46835 RepID=A0A504Z2D8_FASGI|nr:Chaperone protein DnaJ [Fasciola gigantica]
MIARWRACLLLISCLSGLTCCDYYKTLQVSRSATTSEIKSAYRRLAKRLHPDVNSSPDADRKFIELNEAYEVLSNDEKRHQYDEFGAVTGGTTANSGRGTQYRYFHPFGDLFDFFSEFSGGHSFSSNVLDLNFQNYRLTHLPLTRSIPLMVFGYSDFCPPCHRIQPLWSQLADELTPMGVSFASVNLERDASLRDELRVLHVPAVVIIVDGKVTYFTHSGFTPKNIVDALRIALLQSNPSHSKAVPSFLSTTLDTPLIQTIRSWSEFQKPFHYEWRRDSRPRMLLFKPLAVPSLRYILAAFRAADFVAAGFVNTEDESSRELLDRFRLSSSQESLLLFHEDVEHPVFELSAPKLSPGKLDQAIRSYSQLTVPRIYSTSRLLDLCPTDGGAPTNPYASESELRRSNEATHGQSKSHHSHRHVCLVLLLHSELASLEDERGHAGLWINMLREVVPYARAQLHHTYGGSLVNQFQPAHVYTDRQSAWLRQLFPRDNQKGDSTSKQVDLTHPDYIGRLVMIWRLSSRQTAVHLLPPSSYAHPATGFPLSAPIPAESLAGGHIIRMRRELVSDLVQIIQPVATLSKGDLLTANVDTPLGRWYVTTDLIVEELVVDELAAPAWLRMRRKLRKYWEQAANWFSDFISQPTSFFLSTSVLLIVVFVFTLTRIAFDASTAERRRIDGDADEKSSSKTQTKQTTESRPRRPLVQAPVLSLNSLTYDQLILNAPKGHQLLVLCVRGGGVSPSQDERLCKRFSRLTAHCVGSRVQCAQMSLERYGAWLARLLQHTRGGLPVRVRRDHDELNQSTFPGTIFINLANCVGTVVAINGSRRYFSLYHPILHRVDSSAESDSSDTPSSDTEANRQTVNRAHDSDPDTEQSGPRLRRRRIFAQAFGLDSEDDIDLGELVMCDSSNRRRYRSDHRTDEVLLESELLDGLPNWLDRLFEGSLARHQLVDWPINMRGDE